MPHIAIIGMFLIFRVFSLVVLHGVAKTKASLFPLSSYAIQRISKITALYFITNAACFIFSQTLIYQIFTKPYYNEGAKLLSSLLGVLFTADLALSTAIIWKFLKPLTDLGTEPMSAKFWEYYKKNIALFCLQIVAFLLFITQI